MMGGDCGERDCGRGVWEKGCGEGTVGKWVMREGDRGEKDHEGRRLCGKGCGEE